MPVQVGFQRVFSLVVSRSRLPRKSKRRMPRTAFQPFPIVLLYPEPLSTTTPTKLRTRQCLQIYAAQYQKLSRVPWTAEAFFTAHPAQPGAEPSRRVGTITTAPTPVPAPAPLPPAASPPVEEDKGDTTSDTSLQQRRRSPWLMRGRTYHHGSGSCMRR